MCGVMVCCDVMWCFVSVCSEGTCDDVSCDGVWSTILSCQSLFVCLFVCRSRNIRRLNLITYFSGLFPEALEVARQHDLPDVHGNMLRYAPPMEIPWRDVSVHILHRNV